MATIATSTVKRKNGKRREWRRNGKGKGREMSAENSGKKHTSTVNMHNNKSP